MNKVTINGFELKTGMVDNHQVMSSSLSTHKLYFELAKAACQALNLELRETSPEDITKAVDKLKGKE